MNLSDVKNLEYLAKGKRGVVYTGLYKGKKVALKTKQQESKAMNRIEHEYQVLKKLNQYGIGPKVIALGTSGHERFVAYEFVEGILIEDALEQYTKRAIRAIIKRIFEQCFIMDQLGMQKEEMSRPRKHILIKKGKVTMIDFERTRVVLHPSNVTQFAQFLLYKQGILAKKGIFIKGGELMGLAKAYKHDPSRKTLTQLIRSLD